MHLTRLSPLSRRLEIILFLIVLSVAAVVYLATFYPDQGWGDDFAQYISQAANLVQGRSMLDTGYIYNPYVPVVGPRAYPPGFPLMLAPIYALFGLNIAAFQVFILISHVVSLIIIYLLYRRRVSNLTSLVLLAMMALSPYFIAYKRAVMSDTPFMLLCLSFLLWVDMVYERPRLTWSTVGGAALLAFASYLVRTVGFVLILALWIQDLFRCRRLTRFTVATTAFTVVLVVLSKLVFGGGEESYLDQFANYNLQLIVSNFDTYWIQSIRAFWAGPSLAIGSNLLLPILWLAAIPLIIYGFFRSCARRFSLLEAFFILYILVILVWPSVQELRFLYPILPLLLLYAGIGFEGVFVLIDRRLARRAAVGLAAVSILVIGTVYAVRTSDVIAEQGLESSGPYTQTAQDMFTFIKAHTELEDVFVFYKPRALALYTDRSASTFPYNQTPQMASAYMKEINARYAIVQKPADLHGETNAGLNQYISVHSSAFEEVFSNPDFTIYRVSLDLLERPFEKVSSS